MMRAYERLLRYIGFDTASEEDVAQTPSSPCQWDLALALAAEMREMGMHDVGVDDHAYVYGRIPATAGYEHCAAVGFIAHLDTVTTGVRGPSPYRVIRGYDGGAVALGESGLCLTPDRFPHLPSLAGKTLIVTEGTMVLGADDKAGIAEILTLCEQLLSGDRPHGAVSVCFTPDEEIGHGAALMDLSRFGASVAYTVDGSAAGEVEYETFNAAAAKWEITGVSVHPGSGKGVMVNAAAVAAEIDALLPPDERPRYTAGRQGFYHLISLQGDVSHATAQYIIRDHDAAAFARRKETMRDVARQINERYGAETAKLTLTDQYRNMAEVIAGCPRVMEAARSAIRGAGREPVSEPVRGGTDGAQLSFRGLPCPNLGTGGYAFHGPYEHVCVEEMDLAVEILAGIVDWFATR